MNRSELVERLAQLYPQLQLKDAELAVKVIIDALSTTLSKGDRVEIRGFGSFGLNYKPPRQGRNPKTGDKVNVPAKYVPHFKAGKELKERVDCKLTIESSNIESIPKFTTPAAKLWAAIPTDTRKMLLSNVWCGKCRHEVTITNFSGAVRGGAIDHPCAGIFTSRFINTRGSPYYFCCLLAFLSLDTFCIAALQSGES